MARVSGDSPVRHDKLSGEMIAASGGSEQPEAGTAREGDYDVETVERVYR